MTWTPLIATRERIALLWQQMEQFPELRALLGMDTEDAFWAVLGARTNLFVDIGPGLGLGVALGVEPEGNPSVSFLMFDGHLRGQEDTFHEVLGYFFHLAQLRRVTAYTPQTARVMLKLWWRLGFHWEGVLRKAWRWDGEDRDLHVNGLLREEVRQAPELGFPLEAA